MSTQYDHSIPEQCLISIWPIERKKRESLEKALSASVVHEPGQENNTEFDLSPLFGCACLQCFGTRVDNRVIAAGNRSTSLHFKIWLGICESMSWVQVFQR